MWDTTCLGDTLVHLLSCPTVISLNPHTTPFPKHPPPLSPPSVPFPYPQTKTKLYRSRYTIHMSATKRKGSATTTPNTKRGRTLELAPVPATEAGYVSSVALATGPTYALEWLWQGAGINLPNHLVPIIQMSVVSHPYPGN
jgi:hypothetical protein